MKSTAIDMTKGSILKNIILFALPICIGNILQTLYNTVDTMILGRFCDAKAIAAVATSMYPIEIVLCIFIGIGHGISIIVSQFRGAFLRSGSIDDEKNLLETIKTAVFFNFTISIPLSILGWFLGPLVLRLMQAPSDTFDFAVSYIRIIMVATLGNLGFNMNSGILRGMGDSRASLYFLLVSCVVNISLDFLFIKNMSLGVFGAALATAIAMCSSWIISVVYIKIRYKNLKYPLLPDLRHPNWKLLAQIFKIGTPLGLNSSIYAIGHIALQSFINLQGTFFIAGCSVTTKIMSIPTMAIQSFAQAATTFSGQNFGAKKFDKLREGSWKIPAFNGFVTIVFSAITLLFFREILLSMFTKDENVKFFARRYMMIVLPASWCYAVLCTIINYANGAGVIKYPTAVNILMLWAVRVPCAAIIVNFFNGEYVMIAFSISFAFGMFAMISFLFSKTWKKKIGIIKE